MASSTKSSAGAVSKDTCPTVPGVGVAAKSQQSLTPKSPVRLPPCPEGTREWLTAIFDKQENRLNVAKMYADVWGQDGMDKYQMHVRYLMSAINYLISASDPKHGEKIKKGFRRKRGEASSPDA